MNSNSERYNITMDALITSMKAIMPFMQDKNVFEVYVNPARGELIRGKIFPRKIRAGSFSMWLR